MRLLIAGAGGHGRVVADAALGSGLFTAVGFLDDISKGPTVEGWPIVGSFNALREVCAGYDSFAAGVGSANLRMDLLTMARECGLDCPPVIHLCAHVSKHAVIGIGSVICAGAYVSVGARVGAGCIINTAATVDHDCILMDGVHVAPGAHLAGNVRIGMGSWFGIGAVARQRISIGKNVLVGAGAVVVRDVADGKTVVGNPAREISEKEACS